MLQLFHNTPFQADFMPTQDTQGVDCIVVALKCTFHFCNDPENGPSQAPLHLADEYYGDPTSSSLKKAWEMSLPKPKPEILLLGTAYAPNQKYVEELEVGISVGKLEKRIQVFGDRFWENETGIYQKTKPQAFLTMPLVYERAFGGIGNEWNPVGVGKKSKGEEEQINDITLPNLEDPEHLISRYGKAVPFAGLGPIPPTWKSRLQYAGTYGEDWERNYAPYLPPDFDKRFFQSAHPDLIYPEEFLGGEKVCLWNLHPQKELIQFSLPKLELEACLNTETEAIKQELRLDTLLFEPDQNRFCQVYRTVFSCDKKLMKCQSIHIEWKNKNRVGHWKNEEKLKNEEKWKEK